MNNSEIGGGIEKKANKSSFCQIAPYVETDLEKNVFRRQKWQLGWCMNANFDHLRTP